MIDLKQELEKRTEPTPQRDFRQLLEAQRPQIEAALPQAIGAERFSRLVLTEMRRNPRLFECSQESVLGAMMLSAQLGLEPGPLGHAYLVPYKQTCTFIVGYKGMITLAYRSGELKEIVARPVYQGDQWGGVKATETGDHFVHVPAAPKDRGDVVCFYGRARLRSGGNLVHVMYPEEIEARARRSAAFRNDSGPWVTDRQAMQLKTVVRAMSPWLPMSATFGRALEVDERPVSWEAGEIVTPEEAAPLGEDTSTE